MKDGGHLLGKINSGILEVTKEIYKNIHQSDVSFDEQIVNELNSLN